MKNVESKVMEMLQAKGINANETQVKAAIAKATSGKYELSADALDNVAGGVDLSTLANLAPEVLDILKKLGIFGDDDKSGDGGNGGNDGNGGNTQDNSGNSGIQQNNQEGDNSNSGGMTMNKK